MRRRWLVCIPGSVRQQAALEIASVIGGVCAGTVIDRSPFVPHSVSVMSITATVENGAIKLPPGVDWPDGTRVTIEPVDELAAAVASDGPTLAEQLAPFIGIAKGLPPDLAINHDHYLHGARKQQEL